MSQPLTLKKWYGYMALIKLVGFLVAASILLVGCSGDHADPGPVATAPNVYCKSPVTGLPVSQEVALSQAKKHNQAVLALGDTASVIVTVDCGDDVVVVPPVVVTP